MSIKYQDYYKILGIERSASADQIKNAYKKMAKKYHPDVNKTGDAEATFKKINEAYEVLKDPEKRKLYDQFGENWQSGQDFDPSDFAGFGSAGSGGYRTYTYNMGGMGGSGFSDFFEAFFGRGGSGGFDPSAFQSGGFAGQDRFRSKGADRSAKVTLSVGEAYHGGQKTITLSVLEPMGNGRSSQKTKRYQVNIPPGSLSGHKLRMKNMGEPGIGGGPAGDLIIELQVASDTLYRLEGKDIIRTLEVPFYDAILGAGVNVEVLGKTMEIKIPPGSQHGQKLRIREMGMPAKEGKGDLYLEIKIRIPKSLTAEQQKLIQEIRKSFE